LLIYFLSFDIILCYESFYFFSFDIILCYEFFYLILSFKYNALQLTDLVNDLCPTFSLLLKEILIIVNVRI